MDSITFSSSFCLLFYPFVLVLCLCSASFASLSNETDRVSLLDFKAKISDDPLGVMSSWNDSTHFCQWQGVTCGRRHKRVTVLNLASQKLAGLISPHIGNLSFVRELHLLENSFSGEIPPQVGRLRRLQVLRLQNNSLGGEIPLNLTSCSNLIDVHLTFNQLTGKIPEDMGSLKNLKVLSLHSNNLHGEIPSSLGNLSSLANLSLGSNYFLGSIPPAIGLLKNIQLFSISNNSFTGIVPPSIFNLSSLLVFDVGSNQLHGSLPSELDILSHRIQFFSIADNHFTGPIPTSISNASNLAYLYMVTNNLTEGVPDLGNLHELKGLNLAYNNLGKGKVDDLKFLSSLTNATSLEKLFIDGNLFGGVLPESLGNLSTKLTSLVLGHNQIVGKIPSGIANLKYLEMFSASHNQLSFSIPEGIGKLRKLQYLDLYHNDFRGVIPSSLGNLEKLNKLILGRNRLHGSIPSSLGNCQMLLELDISSNYLSGAIPPEVISISSLSIYLDLSQNRLSGALPLEVGNLKNLGILDVSENMLSGEIPTSLGTCLSLTYLSLQRNFFHGTIPPSFRSLRGLVSLDLSRNNVSGEIPIFLQGLVSLLDLNLSFNDLVGTVPTEGIFKNASVVSVEGNIRLCGGIPDFHLPKCSFKEPKRKFTLKSKIIISLVFAFVGVLAVIATLFLFWLRKKNHKAATNSPKDAMVQLSYQTLLNATDGFSLTNLIGVGSFAHVYKGILDHQKMVAIKVFNLERRGALTSFMLECEAMKNIRHRNLVKVITACSSIDAGGYDFKALVCEFMVNGSLEEWLHPVVEMETPREETKKLDLLQRLNIVIDVACALDYLHHQYSQTPIIHCDLKPSNVLLDDEMTAHVSDFGLVKFLTQETAANQTSSIGVRGTVGYAAPEYGMGGEVSTYGDAYSYGILLLEMFTGKKPTDDIFGGDMNLHNYVKKALPEQVAEIVDPSLLEGRQDSARSSGGYHKVIESLILTFEIGIACSKETPRERMDIGGVAIKLAIIRDNLMGSEGRGTRSAIGHGRYSGRQGTDEPTREY